MGLLKLKITRSQLRRASSDQFLIDFGDIPKDVDDAYEMARGLILNSGWKFVRRSGATAHGRKFTMTLRRNIFLADGWDDRSTSSKAGILFHEYVHVLQRKAWGHTRFLGRYGNARGRWEIEVPAYRMSIRVYERFSGGKFNATKYVESKIRTMRKDYWLGSIDWKQYERETKKIWLKERR